MMEFVSWDDEIPNLMGKSFKIPWFQSPPNSKYIYIYTIYIYISHSIHIAFPLCLVNPQSIAISLEDTGDYTNVPETKDPKDCGPRA